MASGRDLLRERGPSATELLAVFGNPDFGSKAELIAQQTVFGSPIAMRSSEMRDFQTFYTSPHISYAVR